MPTIATIGPYRFFFYSNEGHEPAHIHVRRDRFTAKFWLDPVVELARPSGLSAHELRSIRDIVIQHEQLWRDEWDEYFNG
jgi:hypothetical protein